MFYQMLHHHLFWVTLAILFCSAMNIKVYLKFVGTNIFLKNSIGLLGWTSLIAGHIRLFMLALEFNWWWFFGGLAISVVSIGVLSFLFRSRVSLFFGKINFVLIPFFWWYGSKFNTIFSYDWFYSIVEGIYKFFS